MELWDSINFLHYSIFPTFHYLIIPPQASCGQHSSTPFTKICTDSDIALETISTPVQNLKWLLQENGKATEVKAVFNLYDGSLNPPPDRNANSKGDIEIIERGSSQILTNVRINRR